MTLAVLETMMFLLEILTGHISEGISSSCYT